MHAVIGDQLIIEGHKVGEAVRRGEILEVRGDTGGPPFLVRWDDSGRTTLLFPGPDATIKHPAEGSVGADNGGETS